MVSRRRSAFILLLFILNTPVPLLEKKILGEFSNNGQDTATVSYGGQEPSRNRVVVPARQATQPGGVGSLELILGLLKSLKIWALPPSPFSLIKANTT
jgi:hypothetical protein